MGPWKNVVQAFYLSPEFACIFFCLHDGFELPLCLFYFGL